MKHSTTETLPLATHAASAQRSDGVPVLGTADGIYVSDIDDKEGGFVWLRELLSSLTFADVTSDYSPVDEPPASARLFRVAQSRVVGSLLLTDRDGDGTPDSLYHVWVAGQHRRKGVAGELVAAAPGRWPVSSIVGPLNTAQRTSARIAVELAADLAIR